MQKKIIALAVAGLASTAAFAQTNVTIYGVADVGQAWVKADGNNGNPDQKTVGRLDDNNSFIGFKGVEDLGNGLKAVFQYETAVRFDDNNNGFTGVRDSFVGLAGGFGTVAAGRLTHPLRAMGLKVEIMPGASGFGTAASLTGAIAGGIKTGADDRASNAVAYISPTFGGGFSVTAAYVNGEQRDDDATGRAYQIAGQYDNGPLFVGIGYHQTQDGLHAGGPGNWSHLQEDLDARVWRIAAVYTAPFGTKFAALYDNTKVENGSNVLLPGSNRDIDRDAWSLGVSHPFGAHTVGLQYARTSETDISGGGDLDDKASMWSALYTYSLSKRTMVHARYSKLSNDDGGNYNFYYSPVNSAGSTSSDYSGFMLGLRHSF